MNPSECLSGSISVCASLNMLIRFLETDIFIKPAFLAELCCAEVFINFSRLRFLKLKTVWKGTTYFKNLSTIFSKLPKIRLIATLLLQSISTRGYKKCSSSHTSFFQTYKHPLLLPPPALPYYREL